MPSPAPIAIAVVEHDGLFLIGQRPPGAALAGYWEFPGGKVEPGETPEQAAVRECLEETGIQVEVISSLLSHRESYDHGIVDLHFFACRPSGEPPSPRRPYRWILRSRLANYRFPSGNRTLLTRLLATPDTGRLDTPS